MPRGLSRVAYLHASDDWYGSDRVAYESVLALADAYAVEVVLPEGFEPTAPEPLSGRLLARRVTVRRSRLPVLRRAGLSPSGLLRLLVLLIRFVVTPPRADVYVVNTAALALCVPILRARRRRVVVHLHETLSRREGLVLGLFLGAAHHVVTVSDAARGELPRRLRSKAVVLRNFAAEPTLVPLPAGPALRALFVGRWTPRKGVAELIETWAELDPSRFHLTVIGGFPVSGARAIPDPRGGAELPHVEVVGEVSDPTPWMDRAHVVVLPSLLPEGLPLTALEALGRGRPLVATTLGGLSELVTPQTAWTLPVDHRAWKDVIETISIAEVAAKQEACVRLCESTFSKDAFARGLLQAVEGSA